jgi:hypothetical protein
VGAALGLSGGGSLSQQLLRTRFAILRWREWRLETAIA